MGKKACIALDLGYDPWTDEYHDDDLYDYYAEVDANEQGYTYCGDNRAGVTAAITPETIRRNIKSCRISEPTNQLRPFTVVTPKMTAAKSAQVLHYVPNPHRRPLFTEQIATHDGLLFQVASFLNMSEVLTLSMVTKLLRESLSMDGLYCSSSSDDQLDQGGILLPCLRPLLHRLLPHDPERHRPRGISRVFSYECLAFSKSCKAFASEALPSSSRMSTFEPNTILSTNAPEQIATISFRRVQWEQPYYAMAGKGSSPPLQQALRRSAIRLSYVKSETNNCALVTMWSGGDCKLEQSSTIQTSGMETQKYGKERYLPPNTKTIIEASIHPESSLCCILATPLEHYSTERYILSMIALPSIPLGINRAPKHDQKQLLQSDQHTLKWQKHLSSKNWQLFSSSETHPIVSFSSQGTYVVFGSTERWGVVDTESGSRLWNLFDVNDRSLSSSLLQMRFPHVAGATATSTINRNQSSTATSCINAYLLHHEFLFLLERNGTLMRVYDVSNTSSHEPLAEGSLPWSFMKKEKQAQGIGGLHLTQQQHDKQNLRNEYQLTFCAGRIWITGMNNSDLLCSSPPRLLRRLRSRLPNLSSSSNRNGCDIISLRFIRMKTNLNLGVHHTMHTWDDTHLYVVDSDRLHCWKSSSNSISGRNGCHQITTVLTSGSNHIESIHVDGTKIIMCTNCTFRNTTTRGWDESGSIWVIPIDAFELTGADAAPPSALLSTTQRRYHEPKIELVQSRPYSSIMQIYHKRFFSVASNADLLTTHPRYLISSSSNSNYQVVDSISDGRYLLVRCKKGSSAKTAILDLYRHAV
mmetsp:Transcript_30176/g.63940  ORF Transcript_30176/g.63940 Transcript_30176/m.63940 type:complete len:810 (+) Transcript_30176:46-2475(+)